MKKLIILTPLLAIAVTLTSCTTVVKEPATATTTTTHTERVRTPAATETTVTHQSGGY